MRNSYTDKVYDKRHKIGDRVIEYNWLFTPQSLWINNPKFVIVMDHFNDELQYFR